MTKTFECEKWLSKQKEVKGSGLVQSLILLIQKAHSDLFSHNRPALCTPGLATNNTHNAACLTAGVPRAALVQLVEGAAKVIMPDGIQNQLREAKLWPRFLISFIGPLDSDFFCFNWIKYDSL